MSAWFRFHARSPNPFRSIDRTPFLSERTRNQRSTALAVLLCRPALRSTRAVSTLFITSHARYTSTPRFRNTKVRLPGSAMSRAPSSRLAAAARRARGGASPGRRRAARFRSSRDRSIDRSIERSIAAPSSDERPSRDRASRGPSRSLATPRATRGVDARASAGSRGRRETFPGVRDDAGFLQRFSRRRRFA